MPNAGNALGEADCVGGATCIPTANTFAGIGAPAGVAKEGGALGEADCGVAETDGDTMPGGLAKDSSNSGSETNPPVHGAAGEEPLPLPITT